MGALTGAGLEQARSSSSCCHRHTAAPHLARRRRRRCQHHWRVRVFAPPHRPGRARAGDERCRALTRARARSDCVVDAGCRHSGDGGRLHGGGPAGAAESERVWRRWPGGARVVQLQLLTTTGAVPPSAPRRACHSRWLACRACGSQRHVQTGLEELFAEIDLDVGDKLGAVATGKRCAARARGSGVQQWCSARHAATSRAPHVPPR